MTDKEAISGIEDHIRVHKIGEYPHIKIGEAMTLALSALEERIERTKNEPLTLQAVKDRCGKPVFYRYSNGVSGWLVLEEVEEVTSKGGKKVVLHFNSDTCGGTEWKTDSGLNFYAEEVK